MIHHDKKLQFEMLKAMQLLGKIGSCTYHEHSAGKDCSTACTLDVVSRMGISGTGSIE